MYAFIDGNGGGFFAGCALPVIAHIFLLTHLYRLSLRELTSASLSKGENGAASTLSCPVCSIRNLYEVL
jgi:hypothetical protein